jgi:hypothetical protein
MGDSGGIEDSKILQARAEGIAADGREIHKTPSFPPLQAAILEAKHLVAAREHGLVGAKVLIGAAHAGAVLANGATTGLLVLPRTGVAAELRDT